MADFLVAHLKAKGSQHSALATLVNQWGFDSQLIPKALQSVGNTFPHYSRHDESHSKQILINIERLLGDNIERLTATDTWLLLEAAYWHDIGMVVSESDMIKTCSEKEFSDFINEIKSNPRHELHRFASSFDFMSVEKCFLGADTPFDAVRKFRELMAEWFRIKHPARAESIVKLPFDATGITSPRTELIPKRLFNVLARICHAHGQPFSQIISRGGLPFREAGMAREDCHPRFVAALLRLGDLLDLDDNRFCPVMQRIAGDSRPALSRAHEDKHDALRHMRLDPDRIELGAVCMTIDGYLESFRWFGWIEKELQQQMAHWLDIVPSRDMGPLPTLGEVSVSLAGSFQILAQGKRPQFSLDGEKATALLQGTNLYSSKFASIRELLQNAVDATLMKTWLKLNVELPSGVWMSPFSPEVRSLLDSLAVNVSITQLPEDGGDKLRWRVMIKDNGTGISRADLEYMLNIGGSQRNLRRQSIISNMPEWMKPSGAFGIGFQSIFMLSDEVIIITKSIDTNETLKIRMFNPTGPKEGLVLVEVLAGDVSTEAGTELEFIIETEAYASQFSVNLQEDATVANALLQTMDPVLDSTFPYEAALIADQISEFSKQSLIPVHGKMSTSSSTFQVGSSDTGRHNPAADGWHFIELENDAVAIRFRPVRSVHPTNSFVTLYRGQKFKNNGSTLHNASIILDLMSGKAGAWLSANREALASNAEDRLDQIVINAVAKYIELEFQDMSRVPQEIRPGYSLFLEVAAMQDPEKWRHLATFVKNDWQEMTFHQSDVSFRSFFAAGGGIVTTTAHRPASRIEGDHEIEAYFGEPILQLVINGWLQHPGATVGVVDPPSEPQTIEPPVPDGPLNKMDDMLVTMDRVRPRYRFASNEQPPFTDGALAAALASLVRTTHYNQRFLLNTDDRWNKLWLKDSFRIRARPVFLTTQAKTKYIVLPFLFKSGRVSATEDQIDRLTRWSASEIETPLPLTEIRQAYVDLIRHIDEVIFAHSPFTAIWKQARCTESSSA